MKIKYVKNQSEHNNMKKQNASKSYQKNFFQKKSVKVNIMRNYIILIILTFTDFLYYEELHYTDQCNEVRLKKKLNSTQFVPD